jgi:Sec7-like guanine-nucleotide exchange factor
MEKTKRKTGGIARFQEMSKDWENNPKILRKIIENLSEKIDELQAKANISDEAVETFQEIIRNQCDEITALKAQLTWRPVSDSPKKDGWYLCKTQYADDTFGVETVFFNGKNFIYSRVIAWLPIPPAPDTMPDGWEER